jgi:OmpA-OmpF porin, OOP family
MFAMCADMRVAALAAILVLGAGCATTRGTSALPSDLDKDGVVDQKDECPDVPEETGGDGDGCPDVPQIVLESGRIRIHGKIVFEVNSAEVLSKNSKTLDLLAELLKQNTQIKRVQIEGHTDDTGEAGFNQQLSVERAAGVQHALVQRGVEAGRLTIKGIGMTRPLASNETEEGRARNRRVELIVLERD